MSDFWSGWIMGLVVLNMGITLFLFIWAQRVQIPTQPAGTIPACSNCNTTCPPPNTNSPAL